MKMLKSTALLILAALSASCGYRTVAEAGYPAQKIYIAAAAQGSVYTVDTRPAHTSNTPTQGSTFRYVIDGDTFSVPLAVYRSGIDNSGDVRVSAVFDDSVVTELESAGELSGVVLIPEDSRFLDGDLVVADGRESAAFSVSVPLQYLRDAADGSRFAFGIRISSQDREVNGSLDRIAVVIDHRIFEE